MPRRLASIAEYHRLRGLAPPVQPLVSAFGIEEIAELGADEPTSLVQDFYSVALKSGANARLRYGTGEYVAGEGKMYFMAPRQVYALNAEARLAHSGWLLLVDPEFVRGTALERGMRGFEFFGYEVSEALVLSDEEEGRMRQIFACLREECTASPARFSAPVVRSYIELLLHRADRAFGRQRQRGRCARGDLLARLERLLVECFGGARDASGGVPSVAGVARALNYSPKQLGYLLKAATGKGTQEHIHDALIEVAKERLATSGASVGEIAHELGFEYAQSFSKLFRAKTGLTPTGYRGSFG